MVSCVDVLSPSICCWRALCITSFICVLVKCLSAYAKALQLNPLNKNAAAKMAEVLVAQGKAEEAAAW